MKIWYQTLIVIHRMFSFIQKKKEIIFVRHLLPLRMHMSTTYVLCMSYIIHITKMFIIFDENL